MFAHNPANGNSKAPFDTSNDAQSPMSPLNSTRDRQKRCFIISPIGHRVSETRTRADIIRDFVIRPAVSELGYSLYRADEIAEPGIIIQQVINQIASADLVIADLTDLNPNVFYELAVRHYTRRPIITIAQVGTNIPFDLNQVRTIFLDHTDLRNVDECITDIRAQIRTMENGGFKASNPIVLADQFQQLLKSTDPEVRDELPILELLTNISQQVSSLTSRMQRFELMISAPRTSPSRLSTPLPGQAPLPTLEYGSNREEWFELVKLLSRVTALGGLDPQRRNDLRSLVEEGMSRSDPAMFKVALDRLTEALNEIEARQNE